MSFDYNRYLPTLVRILFAIIIGVLLYYIGIPLIKILLPFIVATIFAMAIEPQVKFFQNKLKLGRKTSSLISLLLSLIVFGTILSLIIYRIVIELITLSNNIPQYFKSINLKNEVEYFTMLAQKFYFRIPSEVVSLLESKFTELVNTISGFVTNFATALLGFVFGFISVLPQALIFIIIVIISTYFISSDKYRIKEFFFRQLPEGAIEKVQELKNDLFFAFVGFIKAQIIIMFISILLASTGLTILGIKYAFIIGILIGLAELIPVIGTGSIFTPWIIYHFYTKNVFLGAGLLGVFLLGVIVRQIIEPKIIGEQIGLYPLLTLISIYAGLQLFGVFGMLLGPILFIILKSLNKSKMISLWK